MLLDAARHRGVDWLEPGEAVTASELEAIEEAQGVRLGEGDILVFRTGHHARRLALGAWSNDYPPAGEGKAGLHVDTVPWMHERRIAAFLPDGDGETVPSNVEGMPYPIHPLQMTAMGMCISDSLQLEELAAGLRAGGALGVPGRGPAPAAAGRHGLALEPDRDLLSRTGPDGRRRTVMERRFGARSRWSPAPPPASGRPPRCASPPKARWSA